MSEAAASAPREALSLIHHHPGRLRVRAAAFRSDRPGDAALRVRAALEAEPGITALTHSPRTGSLLVEYQPGLADPEAILARICGAAALDLPSDDASTQQREPAVVAIHAARELNELVHELTGYEADLRSLVPASMVALAAYSFAFRGDDRLPRWDNLIYWSYNIFAYLHRHEIEAARAPLHGGKAESAAGERAARGPGDKPEP